MGEPDEPAKGEHHAAAVGLLLVATGLALIVMAVWRWSSDAGLAALGAVLCLFGFAFLGKP